MKARRSVGRMSRYSLVAAVLFIGGFATAQPCVPLWDTAIGQPGTGRIHDMVVFDDGSGSGPQLYAAVGVGGLRVAKWNGTSWISLGSGMSSPVLALAVFDDGTGAALYAGGLFSLANGVPVNRLAKWNGTTWQSVGGGVTGGAPIVNVMTVHNDGSGPALYVAGAFGNAGPVAAGNIAKWNGTSWAALGTGVFGNVSSNVHTLLSVGSVLYVGGEFSHAGGFSAPFLVNRIARWSGSSWSGLGTGMNFGSMVESLAMFDDGLGGGPLLHAGGTFTTAGDVAAAGIAKWSGSTWSPLGTGLTGTTVYVRALAVFDDGSGPALFAGGQFTSAGGAAANRIAKWNGTAWSALGLGVSTWVEALHVFDDNTGDGPDLYVGGEFTAAGGMSTGKIAIWRGCAAEKVVPGDVDGDGAVNVDDLLAVINGWGACPVPCPPTCSADVNDNCVVNVDDLLMVINNWG